MARIATITIVFSDGEKKSVSNVADWTWTWSEAASAARHKLVVTDKWGKAIYETSSRQIVDISAEWAEEPQPAPQGSLSQPETKKGWLSWG